MPTRITDLHPAYAGQHSDIKSLQGTLWDAAAASLLARNDSGFADTDSLLQGLHEWQRLHRIAVTNLGDDQAFRDSVLKTAATTWQDFKNPPVSTELQHSLAAQLYNAKPGEGDVVSLQLGDYAREIGIRLVDKLLADKIPFLVSMVDPQFSALALNAATPEMAEKLGLDFVAMTDSVNKRITARPGLPEEDVVAQDKEKAKIYARAVAPFGAKLGSGAVFYTLTVLPTRKDAEIDNIPYNDYVKLFFEMCDQPWDRIGKAQESLIVEFNAATHVRITNDDGTDVSMELVDHDGSHFTFCNSLVAKNVPGSEIFSAPRRDSVNGIVVAKGQFSEHGTGLIRDLTMEFKNGELVNYTAAEGLDDFRKAVTLDDGARFVGELGIGTNPHLKQHVCNGLLVEKIGGSFHLALGRPYSYTEYAGLPVKVDNGGKSALHWDITTMLRDHGGCIYLDGRKVMDNGQWLDSRYEILNKGWECVPEAERPPYWQGYFTKKSPAP